MSVAIIGAGISAIIMACRLVDCGYDVTLFEKSDGAGGTWRDNRYPGVACDVPSHLYCWSEELKPDWTRRCAPGAEILRYIERIIDERQLAARIRYRHEVTAARWQGDRWLLQFADGQSVTTDVLICATGALHRPAYPKIDGLDTFRGTAVHSACWRDDVLVDGRRVGVIGTGTTAAQLVPAIASRVSALHVFQRTPSWILEVDNAPTPAWQRELLKRVPGLGRLVHRLGTELVAATFGDSFVGRSPLTRAYIEQRCRRTLRRVHDPVLRQALTPTYKPGCKRLVFSSGYYDAIQRPHVRLITARIEQAMPEGLRTADGQLHELDVIIFATGFDGRAFVRPMAITGENGIRLDDVWARKPIAYRSVAVPHMPNLFLIIGPHSPIANMSVIEIAEWQTAYVRRCVEVIHRDRVQIAPSEAATLAYVRDLDAAAPGTVWASGCDSWYLGDDGIPLLYTRRPRQHRAELAAGPVLSDFIVRSLPANAATVVTRR